MSLHPELQVTQHTGGWVLRLGSIASGGDSFISALRNLYGIVSQQDKITIEKLAKDKVLIEFISGSTHP